VDANCAQCHRPGGVRGSIDARYDTPFANQNILNGPVIADLGIDNTKVVVPKDIWRSALYQRMNTNAGIFKMPPLARNLVDSNAVDVVAAWINQLPGTPALAPPTITPGGGSFGGSVNVSISHADTNAKLYYTLDGTLPTTSSTAYTAPFTLTSNATIKAIAAESGFNNSIPAVATYFLNSLPTIQITSGNKQVALSWPAGQTAYLFEVTDSLTPPIQWGTAPEQPTTSGGQTRVTIQTTSQRKFYRLRQ
jgi:hypothetical protein